MRGAAGGCLTDLGILGAPREYAKVHEPRHPIQGLSGITSAQSNSPDLQTLGGLPQRQRLRKATSSSPAVDLKKDKGLR